MKIIKIQDGTKNEEEKGSKPPKVIDKQPVEEDKNQDDVSKTEKGRKEKILNLKKEISKLEYIISNCEFSSIGLKLELKDTEIMSILNLVVKHLFKENKEQAQKDGKQSQEDEKISQDNKENIEKSDTRNNFEKLLAKYPELRDFLMIFKDNYIENDVSAIIVELKKQEKDKEKNGKSMLEVLKFIDFTLISNKQLETITEALNRSGRYLPYEDYSKFKTQYFGKINQRNLKTKKTIKATRGYLESLVG